MLNYKYSNLYNILLANVKAAPRRIIITQDEFKINNTEFKDKVDAVASYLHSTGIKVNDKVGILMTNSWQFIVNIFAISKIGAIVVPINSFLKSDEINYILNDAQIKLLFTSDKFSQELKNVLIKSGVRTVVWQSSSVLENDKNINYETLFQLPVKQDIQVNRSLDDTAAIVYTSGTTGKPKGAMLSFKNFFSNCEGCIHLMKIKRNGTLPMICYLPMFHTFTLTITVIFPIYTNSGIYVITSISSKKDFAKLLKILLFKRIKYFTGIPDVYSALTKAKLPWYFHFFHNVKGFISGAAPLSEELSHRFASKFKRGTLLEGYGISECSPVVACNIPGQNRLTSVGRALTGYQVKIVNDDMEAQAPGVAGEICVKGDCVMQGYFNRPADTQEAIIDGWFRTGDIGRMDEDGFIYIMDRKKDLIIHKGVNIYPREIEEILYSNEKVNACAVVGVKDAQLNETPWAYIELKEGESATEEELRNCISPFLATYKLPRKFIFMDKLPRNATGKILKRELRDLANQGSATNG